MACFLTWLLGRDSESPRHCACTGSWTLPDAPSAPVPTGIMGTNSVSESYFFSPIHLHSRLVWTAEAPAESAPGQRKKESRVSLEPCLPPRGLAEVGHPL